MTHPRARSRAPMLLLAVAILGSPPATAAPTGPAEQGRLSGRYEVRGATAVDPPDDEPRDTHLVLEIDGDAAKALWRALRVRAVRDACLDDGSQTRASGAVRCTREAARERYRCTFAIDARKPALAPAGAC